MTPAKDLGMDNPSNLSTAELLKFADRSDPVVKVLCARLEVYIEAYCKLKSAFRTVERILGEIL